MFEKPDRLINKAISKMSEITSDKSPMDRISLSRNINNLTSEVNTYLSYVEYDESSKEEILSGFLKSAQFGASDIPTIIETGIQTEFNTSFFNRGFFYSWTNEKGILLKMELLGYDSLVYESADFPLVITDTENVPGDENLNGDNGLEKIFHCSHTFSSPASDYILRFQISDAEGTLYEQPYSLGVSL